MANGYPFRSRRSIDTPVLAPDRRSGRHSRRALGFDGLVLTPDYAECCAHRTRTQLMASHCLSISRSNLEPDLAPSKKGAPNEAMSGMRRIVKRAESWEKD